MSSTTIVPLINILAPDYNRRKFVGPAVKFTLPNIVRDKYSATHKKLMAILTAEYGDANAECYCLFEGMLRDVFQRKPCPTCPSNQNSHLVPLWHCNASMDRRVRIGLQ